MLEYQEQVLRLFERARVRRESILPADWYEANMIMPPGEPFPGPFSYDLSPYWREPTNCIAADDPTHEITVMTINQAGKTNAFINACIGFIISEQPGPIQYLTGHEEGNVEAVRRIDFMMDACRLRERGLIKPQSKRIRNTKSGDTDTRKDFINGHLIMGVLTNVKKDARQHTIRYQFRDDMDAAPILTKSGETAAVFKTRVDSFGARAKVVNISTPELAGLSNIEKCWNRSDKRYYNVPCPKCLNLVTLEWEVDMGKDKAGLYWKLDGAGRVIESSIEYICQKCSRGFQEREKYEMNLAGIWVPTVLDPVEKQHKGYTLNALYPFGMRSWLALIQHYMKAYPANMPKDESIEQTLYNLVYAKPYQKSNDEMKATDLQIHNKRSYKAGEVPEDVSLRDGNGRILMLTCAIDLNGVYLKEGREDDVRLDYEILAWSESGATYSVTHGSIGTFVYRETEDQKQVHREKWTYDYTKLNNVWAALDAVLGADYVINGTGRTARVLITAMDTGNWEHEAFQYVDQNKFFVVGVKGSSEYKNRPMDREAKNFKESASRGNLYILDTHTIKDNLSGLMRMKWRQGSGEQPAGFMNYPTDDVLYQYDNFFSHYEAEHKVQDKDKNGNPKGYVWKKKSTSHQNHCLDLRVYNLAVCEIFLHLFLKDLKETDPQKWRHIKHLSWKDFVELNK